MDKDWIPRGKGYSLYIRPTCIATDVFLGVHPSKTCKVYTICSPSGPYYATGFKPIKLVADEDHVRAWPGGHGAYKLGANYAPTIQPAHEWEKKGYSQLLGIGPNGMIMEGGAMNIFFVIDNEIVTPMLQGSILPGITRKSTIELCKSWGMKVSERRIDIQEIADAYDAGKLQEVFGTGTAAVISPVGHLKWNDKVMEINDNKIGPISQKLYDTMTGIQWGEIADPFNWIEKID